MPCMTAATIVLTVLTTLVFLTAAAMKLTGNPRSMDTRDRLGIEPGRWRQIAVLEIAGVVGALAGLAWRPLGIAATTGLVLLSLGALWSHVARLRDPLAEAAPAVLALVLSAGTLALQTITA